MSDMPSKDTAWASQLARARGASEEPVLGTTAEKIASTSQGVNEKQQAKSMGDSEATTGNSKWKDVPEAEASGDPEATASAQNPVRRKGDPIGPEENKSGEPNKRI